MSKTKQAVIDEQNEQAQANPLLALLQAEKAVTELATVGEGYFFEQGLPLPAVYVQSPERVITATAKAADIAPLTEAVTTALTANSRTAHVSPVYGDEVATGVVWQVIDTQPIQ